MGLLVACGSPAPEAREASGPRRVIVVGMDTVRSDHMGFLGHTGGLTPSLDAVASESVVFEQAWAPAPRTRPSFRSATTGRWPIAGRTAPTLGGLLGSHGFETAGFVANVQLSEQLGFAEGFDTWVLDNMATADAQVDAALSWLRERAQADVLLSLHLMDPHIFYTPPPPFTDRFTVSTDRQGMPDRYNRMNVIKQEQRGLLSDAQKRWIQGRYQGEIAYMDQELGRLVEAVDTLPGETWLIFHSDHGEEFGERGSWGHAHTLYAEQLRVPLIVSGEGLPQAQVVEEAVGIQDIAPTIASWVDQQMPEADGIDLNPAMAGAPVPSRPFPAETFRFKTRRISLYEDGRRIEWDLMRNKQELFDADSDRLEVKNLAKEDKVSTAALARRAEEVFGRPWTASVDGELKVKKGVVLRLGAKSKRKIKAGDDFQVLPYDAATSFTPDAGSAVSGPWRSTSPPEDGAPIQYNATARTAGIELDDATKKMLEQLGYMQATDE